MQWLAQSWNVAAKAHWIFVNFLKNFGNFWLFVNWSKFLLNTARGLGLILNLVNFHFSHIYVLDFTPDDSFLLSGSADETVMIWSLESLNNEPLKAKDSLSMLGPSFACTFDKTGTSILVAPDDSNSLRILLDGNQKYQSPADTTLITCVALSEDCKVIAYGCDNGSVRLYYPGSRYLELN